MIENNSVKTRDYYIKERYNMFTDMATLLEERDGDQFQLEHFSVTETDVKWAMIKDRRGEFSDFLPGVYVRLIDKNLKFERVVMSDTQMERKTNMPLYVHANGHVLIGGLGIGMILMAIQNKPEVTRITVIEKYQEVIDLVASQLPLNEKVEIVCADIFEWKPIKSVRFDTIYMDIWNVIRGELWEEHKKLTRKFNRFLNRENPKAWANSWRRMEYQRLSR